MNVRDIEDPSFIKTLSTAELTQLAEDIRLFLIQNISKTGGHLSSNLGIVELTIAAHYIFNSPIDKIFFDVGHQSYTHKILTGRGKDFDSLRQYNGLSGFQKRNESIHDVWEAGHSSTALSAATGMAIARDLNGLSYQVIPIIGDASMVGGESLEALNHLGSIDSKVIIILNDNQMSISKNVGGIDNFLSEVRTSMTYNKAKQDYKEFMYKTGFTKALYIFTRKIKNAIKGKMIKPSIFSEFGVEYLGPIDGHDFSDLLRAFNKAKIMDKSVVVHVMTQKGKGYTHSENDTLGKWHGVSAFDVDTGELLINDQQNTKSFSQIISNHIHKLMQNDEDIVAITPAMISGSKLEQIFNDFPNRSFDVGIAEAHATTFAAGLACSNKKPYVTIYSSFLQRAYDQINHDIARMKLPVVISVDRAGLVGEDGETHHGVFDYGILKDIPNLVIFSPRNAKEAKKFLNSAFYDIKLPCIIRFPKLNLIDEECEISERIEIAKWKLINQEDITSKIMIAYGENITMLECFIKENNLQNVTLVDACFLKPLDGELLDKILAKKAKIVCYETILKSSSLSSSILEYAYEKQVPITMKSYGITDHYTPQGSIEQLIKHEGLQLSDLKNEILEYFNDE